MTDFDLVEDNSIPDTAVSDRYREDDGALSSGDDLYRWRTWEEHRDDEGYLHHDTQPAAYGRGDVWFFMKHGYAHKADGPAVKVGYLDSPDYWYFYHGKCLGKDSEGWIELWRITKNKDLFKCLDYTGPFDDRSHSLKKLLSFITQEDLKDEVLFNYIWPLVKNNFVPPEVPEDHHLPTMELDDYDWGEQA